MKTAPHASQRARRRRGKIASPEARAKTVRKPKPIRKISKQTGRRSGKRAPSATGADSILPAGAGEMAERIRAFDWGGTALGAASSWSPALRTTVNLLIANRFPMLLWWGPDYVSIYNDAYRPVLGAKHPWGLGKPVRECWKEIWHVLKPLIDAPFHGGPLNNAVKFIAPGIHPRVRIWAENRDSRVRLNFEDNGIGIPPEHHGRIFRYV